MVNDKFEKVADSYSKMFYYSPYYMLLAELLEKYLGQACHVLEIGIADGIVAMAWERVRQESGNKRPLTYFGLDPVERMVEVARERSDTMNIKFLPSVGTISEAIQISQLVRDTPLDGLIISRVLHEIFIQHDLDHEKLFFDIKRILDRKHPKIVVLGIVNRFIGLTKDETERFISEQIKEIGHGHDPAKEYVDQSLLDEFMIKNQYKIVDQKKISQPLNGFDPSPWGETLTVYELS
jgi:ubiquinone/menaquinone biosynthesis C-methylase UbiE